MNAEYYERLYEQLKTHEGYKEFPYTDTVGKLTIGLGHNLTDRGLSEKAIAFIFYEDVQEAESELDKLHKPWRKLDETRRRALTDIMFNLGPNRFKNFRKFWKAMQSVDYKSAAAELLDSRWRQQVGKRAYTLAEMIETGDGYVSQT